MKKLKDSKYGNMIGWSFQPLASEKIWTLLNFGFKSWLIHIWSKRLPRFETFQSRAL